MNVHGEMQVGLSSGEDRKILQLSVEGPLHLRSGVREAGIDEEVGHVVSDVVDVIEVGRSHVAQRRRLTLDDEEGLCLRGRWKSRVGLRDRENELAGPFFERVLELKFVPRLCARLGRRHAEQPPPFCRKTLLCGSAGSGSLLKTFEGVRTGARNGWGKGRRGTLHVVVVVLVIRLAEVGNRNGCQHAVLVEEEAVGSAAAWWPASAGDDGSTRLTREGGRSRDGKGDGSGRRSARSSRDTGRRGSRRTNPRRPRTRGTSHVVAGVGIGK